MIRALILFSILSFPACLIPIRCLAAPAEQSTAAYRRVLILKIDGLNGDLLYDTMKEKDAQTGFPVLPWFNRIFAQQGIIFDNFYTRGISLSAPSWSMLDTGQHSIIRGNVEYDRYTGQVYDYLNIFPFYVGYARQHQVDMPGVEVLDRAGIPLVIDSFRYPEVYQSFQLFQRGTRFTTLAKVLTTRFSSKTLRATIENGDAPSLDDLWGEQTEREIQASLQSASVLYLDLYTGDADHVGHATNSPAALSETLKHADAVAGRLWSGIQKSSLAQSTLFVVVSDHGMNNVPGLFSQGFNLADLLNSPEGGAHHVVTNRHPLSDYKLSGLDPMVHRVVTPSTSSYYLANQASQYPTAWLDLDGNERASVQLRNNDFNRMQIVLQQLARRDLQPDVRRAAVVYLNGIINQHRPEWERICSEMREELPALKQAIAVRKPIVKKQRKRFSIVWSNTEVDKTARRLAQQLADWEREYSRYSEYLVHLDALRKLEVSSTQPFTGKIAALIPELALGDNNTVEALQHYVVGQSAAGLIVKQDGGLDAERSFRYVNYFELLSSQRVHNNPQSALSNRPIDFTVMRVHVTTSPGVRDAYWLYANESSQLLILKNDAGDISLQPVSHLHEDSTGSIVWEKKTWQPDLPLRLFEDAELQLPNVSDRAEWLSSWHREADWFQAIHRCLYSNAVIGITETFSPVKLNVPGTAQLSPTLLRYERRRRELVQPDFEIFAADHWNFNIRNFNPGGNHGGFFRISTHSVWMMAGAGFHSERIETPLDSLNFASTILSLVGKSPPMPDRVVNLSSR